MKLDTFSAHRNDERSATIAAETTAVLVVDMKPPKFLKPGDTMHLGIAKLGEQRQKVTGG